MKLKLIRSCLFIVLAASVLLNPTLRAQDPDAPVGPKVELTKEGVRRVEVKLISTPGQKLTAIAPGGYYVDKKDINQKPTEPKSP